MIGAIIGDIAGSRFEFGGIKTKDFTLFAPECSITDDSLMTLAVAKAILETDRVRSREVAGCGNDEMYYQVLRLKVVQCMQELGREYPELGFGERFANWLYEENPKPYNSWGNGSAMRVSPAGWAAGCERDCLRLARAVTDVTHNHPEGIRGAEATALAIYLARNNYSKEQIRERMEKDYYSLNFTIDEIRPGYSFDVSCQGTVPQAIVAFLESKDFEDAIRIAVSLGGDADTLAAITGSIAHAYYGVPMVLASAALEYLDEFLTSILSEWQLRYP
jgi:type I restriction enzyme M protein